MVPFAGYELPVQYEGICIFNVFRVHVSNVRSLFCMLFSIFRCSIS